MPRRASDLYSEPVIVGDSTELSEALDGSPDSVGLAYIPRARQLIANSETGALYVGDGDTPYDGLDPLPGGGSGLSVTFASFRVDGATVPALTSWTQLAWVPRDPAKPNAGDPNDFLDLTDPTTPVLTKKGLMLVTALGAAGSDQAQAGKRILFELDLGHGGASGDWPLDASLPGGFQFPLTAAWVVDVADTIDFAAITDSTEDLSVNFAADVTFIDLSG